MANKANANVDICAPIDDTEHVTRCYKTFWSHLIESGRNLDDGCDCDGFFQALSSKNVGALQRHLDNGFNPNGVITAEWHGLMREYEKYDLPCPAGYRFEADAAWANSFPEEETYIYFDVKVTPLFYAVWFELPEFVTLLLAAGADPNYVGPGGQTVLHFLTDVYREARTCLSDDAATRFDAVYHRMASSLLEVGAQVNRVDLLGNTPLIASAMASSSMLVKLLLQKGADACFCDRKGKSPLMYAAQYGNASAVAALLAHGADVEKKNKHGLTPLMYAVCWNKPECAKALVEAGADTEVKGADGGTPLMRAAYGMKVPLVKILLDAGANAQAKNFRGYGVLDVMETYQAPESPWLYPEDLLRWKWAIQTLLYMKGARYCHESNAKENVRLERDLVYKLACCSPCIVGWPDVEGIPEAFRDFIYKKHGLQLRPSEEISESFRRVLRLLDDDELHRAPVSSASAKKGSTSNGHPKEGAKKQANSSGGCYIATALYGSYDCPEVWTLRRFRDKKLAKSRSGRMFIRFYYRLSPRLVCWFGNSRMFKAIAFPFVSALVNRCRQCGYSDKPYQDVCW